MHEALELYFQEKAQLQRLIDEHVQLQEYAIASDYFEALKLVNRKIQQLKRLIDPVSDENRYRRKAENINHNPLSGPKKVYEDKQDIDDSLFDLFENKIKWFRLILNDEPELNMHFSKTGNGNLAIEIKFAIDFIEIKMPYLNPEYAAEVREQVKIKLLHIGFLNLENNCYTVELNFQQLRQCMNIKTLLSRVIFDVFANFELNPEMKIFRYAK